MPLLEENLNVLWGSLIVEELVRNGIHYFCVSPGSRSTPLTVAVARHPQTQTIICNDERGAAFHALGYAKGSGKPAVVISTSGTAVANYFPAVVESSFDLVPLLVLSADRPPELRATGANQTIQQPNIFGDYLRWQFDLPCPNAEVKPEVVLTTVDQALYRCQTGPAGPVHLNCPFREPLAPVEKKLPMDYLASIKRWLNAQMPYTNYIHPVSSPGEKNLDALIDKLNKVRRGILVVGHLRGAAEEYAVMEIARELEWPVFPDILSGLRMERNENYMIHYYDQLLASEEFQQKIHPDVILQLGGQITSKRLLKYLEKISPEDYILAADHSFRFDPIHRVSWRLECALSELMNQLKERLSTGIDREWCKAIVEKSGHLNRIIESMICQDDKLTEPAIAHYVSKYLPEQHALYLASSLPVREMDMFAGQRSQPVKVSANRGASGIDGTIASALGYAKGLKKPVTLLIGDLAFLHDINSLMLVQSGQPPITIILINNRGGGIFSFLPIASFPDVFEKYFATPHPYSFDQAAKFFHLSHFKPKTKSEFLEIYLELAKKGKSGIIEIETHRSENFELHNRIQKKVRQSLKEA